MLSEVSSRFLSVERGDDAVIRAVFCADPRPIRVSWRWAAFQMEAGSGSGRFVAEALHKVTPTILPPVVELVNADNDENENGNENESDTTELSPQQSTVSPSRQHPRSLSFHHTTAASLASAARNPLTAPPAVFTYPVCIALDDPLFSSLSFISYRIAFRCLALPCLTWSMDERSVYLF